MASMLIVDDEPIVRRSIARLLADEGHDLVFAHDVSEAESKLDTGQFDVVIADVNMPGESGIELLRRVKRDRPEIAVIMVTGLNDPSVSELAIELGAAAYVVKPFKPTELVVAVYTALQQHHVSGAPTELHVPAVATGQPHGDAMDELLACLARISEIAESELPGRTSSVRYHCAAIARSMGLPPDKCLDLALVTPGR